MHAVQPGRDGLDRQTAHPVFAQSDPEGRPELRTLPAGEQREGRQVPGRRAPPPRIPAANQQGRPLPGGQPPVQSEL